MHFSPEHQDNDHDGGDHDHGDNVDLGQDHGDVLDGRVCLCVPVLLYQFIIIILMAREGRICTFLIRINHQSES